MLIFRYMGNSGISVQTGNWISSSWFFEERIISLEVAAETMKVGKISQEDYTV